MSSNPTEVLEMRVLSADDVDQVSGALAQVIGGVIIGVVANSLYDWLKSPSKQTIPEFLGHL
jgi:hypothetical protein